MRHSVLDLVRTLRTSSWRSALESSTSALSSINRCIGSQTSCVHTAMLDDTSFDFIPAAGSGSQMSIVAQQILMRIQVSRRYSHSTSSMLMATKSSSPANQIASLDKDLPASHLDCIPAVDIGTGATETEIFLRPTGQLCAEPDCIKHASFNWAGVRHRRFCTKHKLHGMVIVGKLTCEDDLCSLQPSFNVEGTARGRFCVKHMHLGMVNVISLQCHVKMCRKQPWFNIRGSYKGLYCSAHRRSGMVNVVDKLCENDMCEKIALHNAVGKIKGRFCSMHKHPDMVNVVSKMCEGAGCDLHASFGIRGTSTRRYCAVHKLPEMVNLSRRTKVNSIASRDIISD